MKKKCTIKEIINKNSNQKYFLDFAFQKLLEDLHKASNDKTVILLFSKNLKFKQVQKMLIYSTYWKNFSLGLFQYLFVTDNFDVFSNTINNSIDCLKENKINDIVLIVDSNNMDIEEDQYNYLEEIYHSIILSLCPEYNLNLYILSNNDSFFRKNNFNQPFILESYILKQKDEQFHITKSFNEKNHLTDKTTIVKNKYIKLEPKTKQFGILDDSILFADNFLELIESYVYYVHNNEHRIKTVDITVHLDDDKPKIISIQHEGKVSELKLNGSTRSYKEINIYDFMEVRWDQIETNIRYIS